MICLSLLIKQTVSFHYIMFIFVSWFTDVGRNVLNIENEFYALTSFKEFIPSIYYIYNHLIYTLGSINKKIGESVKTWWNEGCQNCE